MVTTSAMGGKRTLLLDGGSRYARRRRLAELHIEAFHRFLQPLELEVHTVAI